ncbi:MAG: DPP IV N-terminal domain-containing protein [Candidatus Dormibacteraeota bacterium]|nr:DPP IV N-terminal domain-containing protein [Candidatus Dormibacteraeota bacterium]
MFESNTDVGTVKLPGSTTYDAEQQTYAIAGGGANIWGDHDDFHFVWKRMSGNFIVSTRADFAGTGVEPHRKLGWMVRASLDTGSANVSAGVHGDGLTSVQLRRSTRAPTEEVRSSVVGADVIQLERKGNTYIMSVARSGEMAVVDSVADIHLGDEVYVGLYVCSHNDDVIEHAEFRNVRIVVPAGDDLVPYRDYLGCHLELLDIETGNRRIVYSSREPFEAPNWTPDGAALIYNSRGRLYRFDLTRKTPEVIDTGFATRNNNDHVLSFDGTMIAISHHSQEDEGAAIVYILPVQGGQPKRITSHGPSYMHGWSPDGRLLVYTGQRSGEFHIYRIPVEGGEETQLTSGLSMDDGPEYTPDGRYIYFNSTRSGTMQIWRMQPDGSRQEQLTDDDYNNWFPHVSPDGRAIVYITFPKEVEPSKHPYYQHVYLQVMPAGGGPSRVVASLYGGQGTINVPSWAPDSRRLAFVSNTVMR